MKKLSEADEAALRRINEEILRHENAGDRESLRALLAEQSIGPPGQVLAFRRASGACVDARRFLDAAAPGGDRRTSGSVSLEPAGDHAVIVRCVVTAGGKCFNNLRVFVRREKGGADWRLLAWVNDEIDQA